MCSNCGWDAEDRLCSNCNHKESLHDDPYGCQYERGDKWVDGERMGAWMAQGPCGCRNFQIADSEDLMDLEGRI
jgi:hypothetical protein